MKNLYLVIIVMSAFLFVRWDSSGHRVYAVAWNFGHILLFSLLVVLFFKKKWFKNKGAVIEILTVGIASLFLGYLIEVIQLHIGRSFEWTDIFYDVVGGYVGWLLDVYIFNKRYYAARLLMCFVTSVTLLVLAVPLLYAYRDKYEMDRSFPVLSDFETEYELDRWEGNLAKLDIVQSPVRNGSYSMKVEFLPGDYPGFHLQDFQRNWLGYQSLNFSIYIPGDQRLAITLKVYDRKHRKNGFKYSDRYNEILLLAHGWNDIEIELDRIAVTPNGRVMDLSQIDNVSFFMTDLNENASMFVDGVFLLKK